MRALGYHEFSSRQGRDVYLITRSDFKQHAKSMSAACIPEPIATFDDGHISQFNIAAPLLEEHSLLGHFFIITAWVGYVPGMMRWDHLRQLLRGGHVIGSHTHTHPLLTSVSDHGTLRELKVSKMVLEQHLGCAVTTMSLPGGRMNERVLSLCAEAGYKRVFTSQVGQWQAQTENHPEVIGRYIVRRGVKQGVLDAYLAGNHQIHRRLRTEDAIKSVAKSLTGDSLYRWLWRKMVRSEANRI